MNPTEHPNFGVPEDTIQDAEFDDGIVDSVENGAIKIGSLFLAFPQLEGVDPPEPGDRVRVWPAISWGTRTRGMALRGTVLYYRTAEEVKRRDEAEIVEQQDKEKAEYEEHGKASQQKRYEALPEVFRKRVDVRRRNNPAFGWRFEDYELFACEQATVFAERAKEAVINGIPPEVDDYFEGVAEKGIKDAELGRSMQIEQGYDDPGPADVQAIRAESIPPEGAVRWLLWWRSLTTPPGFEGERQDKEMPGLASNHSGNTFNTAFALAVLWLAYGDEAVIKGHGAMAPIVGSVAYGDLTQEEADALEAEKAREAEAG